MEVDPEVEELVELDVEEPPVEVEVEDPPVDVEVEEPPVDVEDPPVEVEEPPVDVDEPPVDDPPVEVDDPPVEDPPVEEPPVEVEPPLDEVDPPLDVEEMTIPPDPPPPPPPKKPPPEKPPPNPPKPPPITVMPPPPPPPIAGTSAGGSGIGAPWLVMVTTAGGHTARVCVTTRRTRPPGWLTVRRTTRLVFWTYAWRVFEASATCTAPPPTIAPPHAQAHSLAKAIRTDMISLFRCRQDLLPGLHYLSGFAALCPKCRTKG